MAAGDNSCTTANRSDGPVRFIAPSSHSNRGKPTKPSSSRFRAVDYRAHVFVNGALAGSHEGFFAPFEFDITRFVRPGENTLFVQVDNDFPTLGVVNDPKYPDLMGDKLYAATGSGFDDPEAGWHHDPPGMGIPQPVTLEVRPRIHVHDIFVRPLPEQHSAEALIEVWNCDTEPRDLEINFSVHGLNFTQSLLTNRVVERPDPAGAGVNFYRVRFPMPDCAFVVARRTVALRFSGQRPLRETRHGRPRRPSFRHEIVSTG